MVCLTSPALLEETLPGSCTSGAGEGGGGAHAELFRGGGEAAPTRRTGAGGEGEPLLTGSAGEETADNLALLQGIVAIVERCAATAAA